MLHRDSRGRSAGALLTSAGVLCALALGVVALCAVGCGDDQPGSVDLGVAVDAGAAAADCPAYCDAVARSCSPGGDGGVTAPYVDTNDCLDVCGNAARWSDGAVNGNTVTCRLAAAQAAGSATGADRASQCDVAGPTGNNVCGSWCENLCHMMVKNCSGANLVYDAATCLSKCATMPANGKAGDVTGNSVQCRIYHMSVAFHDPVTHCPHGKTLADNPTGPCQ